jgi:hypothetical protein
MTTMASETTVKLELGANEKVAAKAPIFVLKADSDGSLTGDMAVVTNVADGVVTVETNAAFKTGDLVMIDYYLEKDAAKVSEIQIDAEKFAGYYYVEADTLFRRQDSGKDLPANITIPNVKIQSNFTFTMASTGDPSTFTFTMDAFPGYTYFDNTKKVLCVIQVIDETVADGADAKSVMDGKNEVVDMYEDGDDSKDNQDYPDFDAE